MIGVLLLCVMRLSVAADQWGDTDTALSIAAAATLAMDWRQTQQIAESPSNYHETNVIMGNHPSMQVVNTYFVGTFLAGALLVNDLPPKWRRRFLSGAIAVEFNCVRRNESIGLHVAF